MDEEDILLKEALEAEGLQNSAFISELSKDTPIKTPANKQLTFLQKKNESKKEKVIIKPAIYETEKITRYIEEYDNDTGCIRYYYPTLEEFIKNNLPCVKRPWIQEVNGKIIKGKVAYQDPMLYKPGQIYDYVQKWYSDYFTERGIESPFAYSKNNIFKDVSEICNPIEFTLQPHQKFVGSHMSNTTDFPSLLTYHKIGSGKSCTSILVAESNKGTYIKDSFFQKRKGSLIPQKQIDKPGEADIYDVCNIMVVMPKQTINQFTDEIRGEIENGKIKSCTAACVYTEENQQDSDDYIYMRQIYTGKIDKDTGKPVSPTLEKIYEIDNNVSQIDNKIYSLNKEDKESEDSSIKKEIQKELNILNTERNVLTSQREKLVKDINSRIRKTYRIISHQTFLNRISTKIQNNYVASDYILGLENIKGKKGENLIHPDCFHSDKAVLIIDEIHKLTREGGPNFFKLYDTLMINARNKITGEPTMKRVILTGTPIYDNPQEASLMLNFLGPRIPFPLDRLSFENHFIDKTDKYYWKIKNKLCFQYIFSGYLSFSQGANPKGFPFRRNKIILHTMSGEQLNGYLNALSYDIKKDSQDKFLESDRTSFFDIQYRNQIDENQQGRYLWSRQLCNIFLPTEKKDGGYGGKYTTDQIKSKVEVSAEAELDKLISLLSQKQRDEILPYYQRFSPKFHYILQKIIESSEKDEGPIFVYCEWVWYGILAMTKVLELLGWSFLDSVDTENIKGQKKFAIWSSGALKHMKIKDESQYTSNLLKVVKHRNNTNGKLCKVIFSTVTEGISLTRISQVHIVSPWWNKYDIEQAIGRAFRFCSHSDLPIERQYVDVYHHCSVLDSFKDYPKVNKVVEQKIIDIIYGTSTNRPKHYNFRDLARLTIEQKVLTTARRKNDINNQFEIAMKETAIDYQLNKYGNLLRFEEIIYPELKIRKSKEISAFRQIKDNERILYSLSENRYYYYNIDTKSIYHLNMLDKESDDGLPVWPSLEAIIGNKINEKNNWEQYEITHQLNQYSETMVSYIVTENLKSFNNNPFVRDKNFKELMKYAIQEENEDPEVWNYYENQRIKTKMFTILAGLYKLPEGTGSSLLLENFNDRVLSGGQGYKGIIKSKIIRGVANKDLTKELADKTDIIAKKTKDPNLKTELLRLKNEILAIANNLPEKEPLDQQKARKIERRLQSLFFVTSDEDNEKLKEIFINKYHMSREYLDLLTPAQIRAYYDEYNINERNKS